MYYPIGFFKGLKCKYRHKSIIQRIKKKCKLEPKRVISQSQNAQSYQESSYLKPAHHKNCSPSLLDSSCFVSFIKLAPNFLKFSFIQFFNIAIEEEKNKNWKTYSHCHCYYCKNSIKVIRNCNKFWLL
jgi:hypothetical protein